MYVVITYIFLVAYQYAIDRRSFPGNYIWWGKHYGRFLSRDAMLSAVYAVVVCLSVCLCVCVCVCHTPVLYQNVGSRK